MLRLLLNSAADGPTHMATDEALLETAAQPTLRLYRWQPATVSLGYFQDYAGIAARLPRGGDGQPMPVVRRITGGGAIWHEHEVTYCLVGILGEQGLPERVQDCYPLLHGAVLAVLHELGIPLGRQVASEGDRRYHTEPRCFASPAADDLIHQGGGKVLGSAARVRGRRVLVHGSLKLSTNPWDNETVASCGLPWDAAASVLLRGISSALHLEVLPGEFSASELAARERIRAVRYGDEAWVRERRGPRA